MEMCRACMTEEPNMHSIRDVGFESLKICELLNVAVPLLFIQDEDQQLPELICLECLKKLKVAYHFQEMCLATDKRLRVQLLSKETADTAANNSAEEEVAVDPDPLLDNTELILRDCLKIEICSEENVFEPADPLQEDQQHASESVWSDNDVRPDEHDQFFCPDCDKSFDSAHRLRWHAGVHSAERPFQCEICKYRFVTKNHLTSHKASHNTCLAKAVNHAKTKTQPEGQQKCHLSVKSFQCTDCNKSFQKNYDLTRHLRTHTGEKPFPCPQCGKAFMQDNYLRQHLLRHTSKGTHQCPECPASFCDNSGWTKHMQIHSNVKPHLCDICGTRFARSDVLRKHKRIHTGERPYKCEECNMTFVTANSRRRHMRTHTGEKPYKCKFCDHAYAESGDLTKHLRSHVGRKTYICTQCPEAFKYQSELRIHVAKHYKEHQKCKQEGNCNDKVEENAVNGK